MSTRRGRRSFRLPIVLVVAALAGGAIYLDRTAPEASGAGANARAVAAAAIQGPTVPRADSLSTAWYCAEGTSNAGGRDGEIIVIGNLSSRPVDATVTVMPGGTNPLVTKQVHVAGLAQARVPVSEVLATPEPGVVVEVFGGPAVVEHILTANNDIAIGPCARDAGTDWYFAAGTTARDSKQFLALFNPYGDDAIVDITVLSDSGVQAPEAYQGLVVPRRSRVSAEIDTEVRRQDHVALFVHARAGRVVAERSEIFDGSTGRFGIADSLGATAPAPRWVVPFGSAQAGATHAVAVANFALLPTEVEVDVLVEGNPALQPQTVPVPGRSVVAVDVGSKVANGTSYSVSVHVTRGGPVVVESLVTQDGTGGGAQGSGTTIGANAPADNWAFAIGRTNDVSDARIVAYNPGPNPVTVELRAYTAGDPNSPHSAPAVAIPAGDRGEFDLGAQDVAPDQVFVVASNGPVVVGRELDVGALSIALGIPFVS